MKRSLLSAAACFCLCLPAVRARADLAPTQYIGSDIAPVNAADIRMLNAKVDIEWDSPCQLTAVFVLDNQSDHTVDIPVGFPVSVPASPREKSNLGFTLTFDGVPVSMENITQVAQTDKYSEDETTWYRCQHAFPPGKTTVRAETRLPASKDYGYGYVENLFYIIQTGGAWKGAIGSEEVNIHFPEPVTPAQVLDATPVGYKLDGNTVRWQFTDFKPKGEEYDIHLRYLRPGIVPTLARLRAEVARDPANLRAALDLAKCLFALGSGKEYYGHIPFAIDEAEYQEVLGKLTKEKDRTVFRAGYVKQRNGGYRKADNGVNDAWQDMEEHLNAAEYISSQPMPAGTREAKGLIERVLQEQPHNAEAWAVYLVNYHRFHYVRHDYRVGDVSYPSREEPIQTAYRNCPDDPFIRQLWRLRKRWIARTADETEAQTRKFGQLEQDLQQALEKKYRVYENSLPTVDHNDY